MFRTRSLGVALLFLATALPFIGTPSQVSAATISLIGPTDANGTGFGSTSYVLGLQDPGSDKLHPGEEWGGVSWDGNADVPVGEIANGSSTQTWRVNQLTGINANNLSVIFNVNQTGNNPGQPLHLHQFQVIGYNSSGATLFTATYDASILYGSAGSAHYPLNNGVGKPDYAFSVTGVDPTFFDVGTNRLGLSVPEASPIDNVADDGPDEFYFAANLNPVPEPSALALAGIALAGFGLMGLRRLRRRV